MSAFSDAQNTLVRVICAASRRNIRKSPEGCSRAEGTVRSPSPPSYRIFVLWQRPWFAPIPYGPFCIAPGGDVYATGHREGRLASLDPSLVKIQIGRMMVIGQGDGKEVVWRRF